MSTPRAEAFCARISHRITLAPEIVEKALAQEGVTLTDPAEDASVLRVWSYLRRDGYRGIGRVEVGAALEAAAHPRRGVARAEAILETLRAAAGARTMPSLAPADPTAPDVRERLATYLCALKEGHMRTAYEREYWFRKADECLALFPQLDRLAQPTLRDALAKMFFETAHPQAVWNAGHEDDGSQWAYDNAYGRADYALSLIAAQEASA